MQSGLIPHCTCRTRWAHPSLHSEVAWLPFRRSRLAHRQIHLVLLADRRGRHLSTVTLVTNTACLPSRICSSGQCSRGLLCPVESLPSPAISSPDSMKIALRPHASQMNRVGHFEACLCQLHSTTGEQYFRSFLTNERYQRSPGHRGLRLTIRQFDTCRTLSSLRGSSPTVPHVSRGTCRSPFPHLKLERQIACRRLRQWHPL
jgi:hypothetical protein